MIRITENLRIVVLIAIACAVVAILLLLSQCEDNRRASAETELSRGQARASSESAKDAVGTVGGVAGRATDTDTITRENDDEIRNAPGADAPVDPALSRIGRDSLCKRAAYRGHPECMHRAPSE